MGFNDFLDDVGVPGVGSPPPEVQRNVMYGGRPQKKYGFLEGLRDVLGGFNAVKRIDDTGFDWREQDAARQAARDQELQKYQQANEDYFTKAGAEAAIGGMPENELESLLPAGLDPARRRAAIARMIGQSAQAKSSLKDQDLYRTIRQQEMKGLQDLEKIGARGDEAAEIVMLREKIRSGQQLSPREQAQLDAAEERVRIAQSGANYRAANFGLGGRGGRPQLRLVSDGQGGTEYRWISPGETAPGAPTASQRETAGMAEDISSAMSEMRELAPDVTHGPFLGRLSELWQSQYPSGKEADFDTAIARLVNFAYIKSGKQINKIELEQDLRKLISRSRGDLPGQVERAMPYVERILKPYERTGAIQPEVEVSSREQASKLPNGAVFTFKGKRIRKIGPGQYEAVP